tara:strand:- start:1106 stop:3376 length:2271 start_codon:yes stop_codon:yes gene_type:complete
MILIVFEMIFKKSFTIHSFTKNLYFKKMITIIKKFKLYFFINRSFISIFFIFFIFKTYAQEGLKFVSNNKDKIERTSYKVFEKPKNFKDKLSIKFDLSFHSKLYIGNIFTINGFADGSSYSLYYKYTYEDDNLSYIQINRIGEEKLYEFLLSDDLISREKWVTIELSFNFKTDSLQLLFNGKKNSLSEQFAKDSNSLGITFGRQENYFDVPAFKIRNLQISDTQDEYIFPLNQQDGTDVYDANFVEKGIVTNPDWLINDFYHWKKINQIELEENYNVVFNSSSSSFLLLGSKELIEYDVFDMTTNSKPYKNTYNLSQSSTGKAFLDLENNKLYNYQIQRNDIVSNNLLKMKLGIKDDPIIEEKSKNIKSKQLYSLGVLDLDTFMWSGIESSSLFSFQRFHHNTFFQPNYKRFTFFGGYGNFSYFNDISQYDIEKKSFNTLDFSGDFIPPRFLSGMLSLDSNTLLIYGGVGNLKGEEHIGRKYFSDLYQLNLESLKISKKWSNKSNIFSSASSENMILSDDRKSFFTVSYSENFDKDYLKLKKLNIENGTEIFVGDSILMATNKVANKVDIFESKINGKILLYTKEFQDNRFKKNIITFYSIENEPILFSDLNKGAYPFIKFRGLYLGIFILLIVVFFVIRQFFLNLKKESTNKNEFIFVRSNRQNVKLFYRDIWAVEALKDYIKIICSDKTYVVHNNISKFSNSLPKSIFIRVHRSFIINLNKISSVEGDIVYLEKKYYKIGGKYMGEIKKHLDIN